jgi:hypothetical protein
MSSTHRTQARSRAFTARSTLSVLVSAATSPGAAKPLAVAEPKPAPRAEPKAAPRAPISREERHRMIAKVAYAHAERAGFGSDPLLDWLSAEREIDSMLAKAS